MGCSPVMVMECCVASVQLKTCVEGWLVPYQAWVLRAWVVVQVSVKLVLVICETVGNDSPEGGAATVTEAEAAWVCAPSEAETVTVFAPVESAEAGMETVADCPGAIDAGLTWQPEAGAVQVSVRGVL